MKKQQSGFTLIELVIVIVILGLLAATALPRFSDLTDDAEAAVRSGTEGAVRSAAAIAHAQSLVDGTADAASATITMDGVTVDLDYGYPDTTGIQAAVDTSDITEATSGSVAVFTIATSCTVTYTPATSATGIIIGGDETGCP